MSVDDSEKKELPGADSANVEQGGRAEAEAEEAERVLAERRVKELVLELLKADSKFVRVVDVAKRLPAIDKKQLVRYFNKLVADGVLEPGNASSSSPNLKQFPPTAKTLKLIASKPIEAALPTQPKEAIDPGLEDKKAQIAAFIGDEGRSESEVKEFMKGLGLPNKNARRNLLADLVAKDVLSFEGGKYSKFREVKNDTKKADVVIEPTVEPAKDVPPVSLDEKAIEGLRPVIGKVKEVRGAMIQMMNHVEGGRRVASKEEKDNFYSNLRIFLETARSAESAGLRLSTQGEEQRRFLEEVDALTEKRLEDEDSFRRAVIGIGNELATKLKLQERRLERERAAASAPEPRPDAQKPTLETDKRLNAEEVLARNKSLERAREEIVEMMATIHHPTAEQQKELREKLGIFLKSTNELQESGLLLSAEALKGKTLLEWSMENRIFNPRQFRMALQRIDDEFLAQASFVEKEGKKSTEVTARPLISSEKFPDDKYHRFGDFEKRGFTGVYMGHEAKNQDAFAVNEKAVALGDGMGNYALSGLLSRHVAERMAARLKKPASYEEFQKLFEQGSLGALLTVIKDDKRYQHARDEMIATWNPSDHDDKSWAQYHQTEKTEATTTFSVIRESDDGTELYYAIIGDSPIIVVDRDDAGVVTGWQLLNEQGVITDLEGKKTQVDITDRTAYNPDIIRELRGNIASGIGLTADRIAMYGDKTITGRIPKKENQLVIVASDGLTKLITRSPMALEEQAVLLDKLRKLPDEQFVEYVRSVKDERFLGVIGADGTANPDVIAKAKTLAKEYYDALWAQAKAVQKKYPQLWNGDGSLNMLAVLDADPKTLEFARDDLTFIVAAAGEQKAALPARAIIEPEVPVEKPVVTPEVIAPTAQVDKAPTVPDAIDSVEATERLNNIFEDPMILRARARMVLEILNLLPGEDPLLREQIAQELVSKIARELVESYYDKRSFISGDQLKRLLPLLKERLSNEQDLLADLGPKITTWRELAQRISSGMDEVGSAMHKAWLAQYPGRKNDFFDYEGNTLYDLSLAANQWIVDLKNNTTLDATIKRLLLVNLERAKREAEEKLETWSKEKTNRFTEIKGITEPAVDEKPAPVPLEAPAPEDIPASVTSAPSAPTAPPVAPDLVPPPAPVTPLAVPKISPRKKSVSPDQPIDIKFEGGKFTVSMAEAFRNDVFYNFFQKFDAARNPGAKFDATLPGHDERYEKGLEAYMLWREAIQAFRLHAAQRLERDLGIKPYPEDLVSIESDLERLIMADTQQVRGLIDQINAYAGMEEDEARKENELIDLGGLSKVQNQVDELDKLRHEKKTRANEFIASLRVLSRQSGDAARAFEVKNRTWFQWAKAPKKEKGGDRALRVMGGIGDNTARATSSFFGGVMDRLRGAIAPTQSLATLRGVGSAQLPEGASQDATGRALDKFIKSIEDEKRSSFFGSMINSAKQRFRGLLRGKEALDLERKLQSTYGMSVDEAAESYPDIFKRERAFELQTNAAIAEYEKLELRYHQVKDQIFQVQRAQQEKERISNQFDQLRRNIIADTGVATTVARLTAGRSVDIIKGLMDPVSVNPSKTKKAEDQLASLRRAADFEFNEGRYAGVLELAPMVGEGALITDADNAIREGVENQLKQAVLRFKKIDKKGVESISKTFVSYGERGYELGVQVLSDAVIAARAAKDDRRANILQVLLLELRTLKT